MTVCRTWISVAAVCLSLTLAAPMASADFTAEEAAYKREHLQSLRPYGMKAGRDQRDAWIELIGLAAKHRDYEIVAHILSLSPETSPATRAQYAFDLLTLFAHDPEFFIDSVNRFYGGDCDPVLHLWIDSSGDITADLLRAYVPSDSDNVLLINFIAMAEAREDALHAMN